MFEVEPLPAFAASGYSVLQTARAAVTSFPFLANILAFIVIYGLQTLLASNAETWEAMLLRSFENTQAALVPGLADNVQRAKLPAATKILQIYNRSPGTGERSPRTSSLCTR